MKRLRYLLEAAAFAVLLGLSRVIPRSWIRKMGRGLGALARRLNSRHRTIALTNLQTAMPHLSDDEALEITHNCWKHFGEILLDTLSVRRLGPDSVGTEVHYEGLEHVQNAYGSGRGVLLFSGHFGHWELIALMQGHLGLPLSIVARPLDNPYLEKMLTALRGSSGNILIYKRHAVRAMVKSLRNSIGAALLIDQDAREEGVFVPFFGRPASTTPTLARLALRTGAMIIPMYSVPRPDGSWTIIYEPPVEVDPEADRIAETHRVTALCTAKLEGWIRQRPELWLWMHRRWKSVEGQERID
ncbi:MAG: lysophospholipid acyltransferase family protein [Acidobacteriota bacterium]|nr:lysophospholipid acyltransferase family protein [Acidobacteriota bacterium]MDH3784812.1 lysophospholipid acyltransferase family protein [Acidobacteriota bacterium]